MQQDLSAHDDPATQPYDRKRYDTTHASANQLARMRFAATEKPSEFIKRE